MKRTCSIVGFCSRARMQEKPEMFRAFSHKRQRVYPPISEVHWGALKEEHMKRNRFGILTTLALALLISVPLSAQTTAKATVPFDFTVGQTRMPAGTYEVSRLSDGAILIRDNKTAKSVVSLFNTEAPKRADSTPKLVFHRYGDKYFLSQVFRGNGGAVLRLPTSKLEEEERIAGSSVPEKTVIATK